MKVQKVKIEGEVDGGYFKAPLGNDFYAWYDLHRVYYDYNFTNGVKLVITIERKEDEDQKDCV